jgi:hypothetical protein
MSDRLSPLEPRSQQDVLDLVRRIHCANKHLIGYTHHPLPVDDERQLFIDTFLVNVIDWFRAVAHQGVQVVSALESTCESPLLNKLSCWIIENVADHINPRHILSPLMSYNCRGF